MTDVATKPRPRPAHAPARPAPARRPRRVSGPLLPPARGRARRRPLPQRLGAFLRSLPDHTLLDRLVRGRFWIPLVGLMLGGIVALQVELLKLGASTSRSIELASGLQSRNDVLRAQVAADSSPGRIEGLAVRMGMVMPGPESITFLGARDASPRRAARSIHPPDLATFEATLQASNAASTLTTPLLTPPPPSTPKRTTPTSSTTTTTPSTSTTTTTATSATTAGAPPPTVP